MNEKYDFIFFKVRHRFLKSKLLKSCLGLNNLSQMNRKYSSFAQFRCNSPKSELNLYVSFVIGKQTFHIC